MNPALVQTALIVVFYHPTESQLQRFVQLSHVMPVIAVDNSDAKQDGLFPPEFTYIPLCQNRGIAAAQNVGIRKAEELGAAQVIFFDQDSSVSRDLLKELVQEFTRIKTIFHNLATVGPLIINQETHEPYKIRQDAPGDGFYRVPTLISSGSVVEINTLHDVGPMREDLFIDGVDHEWCWRAQSKGYVCCVSERVQLPHKVGQRQHHLFGFSILEAAPVRYYYRYRNAFILSTCKYIPTKHKLKSLVRHTVELFYAPCVVDKKFLTLKYMFKGIVDGLKYYFRTL